MKRLYLQIYLTVVASLALVVLSAGVAWRFAAETSPARAGFEIASELAAAALPPAGAAPEAQQHALERLAVRLHTDLALFDAARNRIAATGAAASEAAAPLAWHGGPPWRARGWKIDLPDGRALLLRPQREWKHPVWALMLFLGAIALGVALAAYPLVRRLTRRLERLQASVEALGSGDLSARVQVAGCDEVAQLAESFNRSATRIEELVGSHRSLLEANRRLLAHTSHELRTPLARIRLGIELLKDGADPARRQALERDIAELDQLIDEILLASRLESVPDAGTCEPVDLLALAAEECARYDECTLEGEPAVVEGDARLLRRMLRNLLDNAARHGRPPIEVRVARDQGRALVTVCDHGAGVPALDLERVFEPFYRLPGAAAGTGLGLALVRQIAERHGGTARAHPRDAGRACISIDLPAARDVPLAC